MVFKKKNKGLKGLRTNASCLSLFLGIPKSREILFFLFFLEKFVDVKEAPSLQRERGFLAAMEK